VFDLLLERQDTHSEPPELSARKDVRKLASPAIPRQ